MNTTALSKPVDKKLTAWTLDAGQGLDHHADQCVVGRANIDAIELNGISTVKLSALTQTAIGTLVPNQGHGADPTQVGKLSSG